MKVYLYKVGNIATLYIRGKITSKITTGSKETYLELPSGYKPYVELRPLAVTQNGNKLLFSISRSNVGLYYVLDEVPINDNVYCCVSWAIYS
jgi:hypothetical protein